MKMFKKIPVFILLFTGYLCSDALEVTSPYFPTASFMSPSFTHVQTPTTNPTTETQESYHHVPEKRSLPTLVVAGVSIALVLLCILIVAVFWYAWKKSQECSMELNPIPYAEAGVSLRNPSGPENQQEWPFERAAA